MVFVKHLDQILHLILKEVSVFLARNLPPLFLYLQEDLLVFSSPLLELNGYMDY